MQGGTLVVNDNATAQIDTATGGTLRLLEEGLATAQLGSLDVSTGGTAFSFDSAYARGDAVHLGLVETDGEGMITSHSEPGKVLNIGTMEYGAFFEYGTGNYTTHDDDRRGDGSMKYTGGGVLAKWTANHGFYVEGSLRTGTVHDDARNVLSDGANSYSYETDAGYFGAHLGAGKEIQTANNDTVDVYAKFFFNRRNGVSFETGGNAYDLDAVKSEILRVGARYTMKRAKWNFYGGLAYEHEFGGEATGTMNGLTIRSANVKGSTFRAELGATLTPDANSPWSLDLSVAGYAGKKQGVVGGVSVTFAF